MNSHPGHQGVGYLLCRLSPNIMDTYGSGLSIIPKPDPVNSGAEIGPFKLVKTLNCKSLQVNFNVFEYEFIYFLSINVQGKRFR